MKRFCLHTGILLAGLVFWAPSTAALAVTEVDANNSGANANTYESTIVSNYAGDNPLGPDLLKGLTATVTAGNTVTQNGIAYVKGQSFPVSSTGYYKVAGQMDALTGDGHSLASAINDGTSGIGTNNAGTSYDDPGNVDYLSGYSLQAMPTFTFALGSNQYGYTITGVQSFATYLGGDAAASDQVYNISYSTVSNPTVFTQFASVDYTPFTTATGTGATEVTLTNLGLPTNVADIQIELLGVGAYPYSHGQIFSELDVYGEATPEPTTWAMLAGGFGLLCTILRSRRLRS